MSHHSDDQLLQAGSDSFWEPGNYKRTTKRIEDGYRLCTDLQTLIQERAEIEKGYAKNLRTWSKKWGEIIDKGPEYGTMEAGWKGILTEAERLADIHLKVKDNLTAGEMQQIRTWQKDNYHKTMIHIKERKEMEDQFKKAQKPWAKLLGKVEKAKVDYHAACKTERTATNQERNAIADSSLSPDQIKKMQDRVNKTKDDVLKSAEKYELALKEINQHNPIYMEDMTTVFLKCQEIEETRLRFFKSVLFDIHKSLNFFVDPSLQEIYDEFYHTINNSDHRKDLKLWSNNHGVNMAMNWPSFVEYTEEFRDIAKGNKAKEALPTAPITLIHQRPVGEELPEYPPVTGSSNSKNAISTNVNNSINRMSTISTSNINNNSGTISSTTVNRNSSVVVSDSLNSESPKSEGVPSIKSSPPTTNRSHVANGKSAGNDANPFDEEEWDEGDADNILVDNGEPGVPVRALYDYDGAESDELTFKHGETFEKLEDEDEQGWCKGRKGGKVGLYPANYVEVVST